MSGLPKGWVIEKLDKCTAITMGQSPKGIYVNSEGEGIPFYQGKSEFGKLYPIPKKYCTEPSKLAIQDDILLSVRAPVGPTNLCPETSCIGRGLASIRALEPMSQMYFLHYMRYLQPWLSEQGTGTTFKAISGAFLKDIEVIVAPLNEQIRIANKLDSILAKVDKAQARLDKIPAILKRFRQSVLAAATSGELTKEWRGATSGLNEALAD
ncbi:4'-phosphopantetheinyl transferase, partial [Vibrio parahaemolyticus]